MVTIQPHLDLRNENRMMTWRRGDNGGKVWEVTQSLCVMMESLVPPFLSAAHYPIVSTS